MFNTEVLLSGGGGARASCWLLEELSLGGAAGLGYRHVGEALPKCLSLGQAAKAPVPGQMLVNNQRRLPVGKLYISFQTGC